MKELVIAPSILSLDYSKTSEQLEELDKSNAKWMHFDVMDGHLKSGSPCDSCGCDGWTFCP